MELNNKEIRSITEELAEVRLVGNSRKVEGYGIVFNSLSQDLGGFREMILPEAVEGVLERSDILTLLNHDISRGVLARSVNGKGTLNLSPDKKGVKYEFEAPRFDLGDELIEGVKRGDIKGSSFGFAVAEEEWDYNNKPVPLRTIKKFDRIFDISPCYREAYKDTTVALRSLDEHKNTIKDKPPEDAKPAAEDPAVEPIAEWRCNEADNSIENRLARQQIYFNKIKNL